MAQTVRHTEAMYPGLAKEVEGSQSFSWARDPWSKGELSQFNPGQYKTLGALAGAEGRIHFAGEHTSNWGGWMEGALESAVRCVGEISLRG